MKTAAPAPNNAAAPTAPVLIGMAGPLVDELTASVAAGPAPSVVGLTCVVGVGWSEVNGTSEADDAPVKPGAPVVAEGSGPAVALGLRTLRKH